ncbi:MAG: prolyl oligopeptidase family serine peptidase [Armatimonadetes bacterium]|nr:prolyl oligopeptidase family serine peptidase [Armatimonadota bacterium]
MSMRRLALFAVFALALASLARADGIDDAINKYAYIKPAPNIEKLVTAAAHLNVSLTNLSPDGKHFLIATRPSLQRIADMAKPYYNLGGLQVDRKATRSRNMTARGNMSLSILDWESGEKWAIQIPEGATTSGERWSPDGSQLAFFANFDRASYLYVAEVKSGKVRRLNRRPLLATYVTSPRWTDSGNALVAVFRPDRMDGEPNGLARNDVPLVRVTDPKSNRLRTYATLLDSPHQMDLYEYFTTGVVCIVDMRARLHEVGDAKIVRSIDPSPVGRYVRVTTVVEPFSHIVPHSNFGTVDELWDEDGEVLHEFSKRPLREGAGGGGGRGPGGRFGQGGGRGGAGMRSFSWRPDGAGLSYLHKEEKDEDDPDKKLKDRVMLWKAPYGDDDKEVVYESEDSIGSVQYSADASTLFITQTKDGASVTTAITGDDQTVVRTFKSADFYKNPGSLMTTPGPFGRSVVRIHDGNVFLRGTQYNKDPQANAPRPFIDAVSMSDGESTRVWQSAEDVYETLQAVLGEGVGQIVVQRQSKTTLPDSHLINTSTGDSKKLTKNKEYRPEMTELKVERFQVTRPDGFKFWVKATMPEWWSGNKLPAFFWFYPSEFTDQKSYDERGRTYNKNSYPRYSASSKQFFTQVGYAVIEPDCPIVGADGRWNDNFLHDLRTNLSTVIDECERRGMIDRDQLAIGGHSYGAFGTANAMVQTPFFKAGIAGDGNYNRTLTPMAFQRERRLLYEAREVYTTMSPLLYANQLTGALLMYHGMEDQNVGTNPTHAERMYHMLESNGKTAALYMYPHEGHGPRAEETLLDMWARWIAWLDKYVTPEEEEADEEDDDGDGE